MNIQQIMNSADSTKVTRLPLGEYEGPFTISKPCILVGNATTLWAKKGPVLIIKSNGVTINDLRIEITESPNVESDFTCISTSNTDTIYNNIEIIGNIDGILGESDNWDIPKIIPLGSFLADNENTFMLELNVPVKTKISSTIKDITFSPTELQPGVNTVSIVTDKMKENTFLYGELLFESQFIRRAYVSGQAKKLIIIRIRRLYFAAEEKIEIQAI